MVKKKSLKADQVYQKIAQQQDKNLRFKKQNQGHAGGSNQVNSTPLPRCTSAVVGLSFVMLLLVVLLPFLVPLFKSSPGPGTAGVWI